MCMLFALRFVRSRQKNIHALFHVPPTTSTKKNEEKLHFWGVNWKSNIQLWGSHIIIFLFFVCSCVENLLQEKTRVLGVSMHFKVVTMKEKPLSPFECFVYIL